jgi:transcriptional regulator with XRE-family HTH domain
MDLQIFKEQTNTEILEYLSIKILRERRARKLSQSEFAKLANISLRTYKRIEQNSCGSLENFINVLRAFDKLNFLQTIFIEESLVKKLTPAEMIGETMKKSHSRD